MVLHTEQCLPSVRPVTVHVTATAESITSVWPRATICFCSFSPQAQERSYAPSWVQVASFTIFHAPHSWICCFPLIKSIAVAQINTTTVNETMVATRMRFFFIITAFLAIHRSIVCIITLLSEIVNKIAMQTKQITLCRSLLPQAFLKQK